MDEMIKKLKELRFDNGGDFKKWESLDTATKVLQLLPELADWNQRLQKVICLDHCRHPTKTECDLCWMQQPKELIQKLKEIIDYE
jgi:hypothetical protein